MKKIKKVFLFCILFVYLPLISGVSIGLYQKYKELAEENFIYKTLIDVILEDTKTWEEKKDVGKWTRKFHRI